MIRRNFRELNLARRYLWGAMLGGLLPLAIISVLYDRYSVDLQDRLLNTQLNSNLESAASELGVFLSGQINRLENLADLSDTADFFLSASDQSMTTLLADLLLLETESPDIYAIELSDLEGNVIRTVPPTQSRRMPEDFTTIPQVLHNRASIFGPVTPRDGKPGWFLVSVPVTFEHQNIGIVSFRLRLASLTERISPLAEPGVFEPQIVVFDRVHLSDVGTSVTEGTTLAKSKHFFPGWKVNLVEIDKALNVPRDRIRTLLIVAAVGSTLAVLALFYSMSERLSRHLAPLNRAAKAISNGNFEIEVREDGPGEIGSLARSYNRMRQQLESLIDTRVDVERQASLGTLAAGIAHEIRNPLTTVAATVHNLQQPETDKDRRQMFEVISSEIARVDLIISEFLIYARPSRPNPERIRVRDVVTSLRTLVATQARQQNVEISLSGDSNLTLVMDPKHLQQILLNLTLNSMQAMPNGGRVKLRAYREDDEAVITLLDDGPGMDKEQQKKALRPFYTTKPNGTGLGLSMTAQLVKVNGGTMTLESGRGIGTVFTLRFPSRSLHAEGKS